MGRQNAKTLDRDRTSYSFNAALAAQTASPFNFEIEPENIILVALRAFEFSHSLGHKPTLRSTRTLACFTLESGRAWPICPASPVVRLPRRRVYASLPPVAGHATYPARGYTFNPACSAGIS